MRAFTRVKERLYFAGKSKDSWWMLSPNERYEYKKSISDRDGCICKQCKKDFKLNELSVDHIMAISLGGPVNDILNMQLLCFECHKKKTESEYIPE